MAEEGPILQDWEILQRKIFTRWVNQKLLSRQLPVLEDVVDDLGQNEHLGNLIFALTEKRVSSGSPRKTPANAPAAMKKAEHHAQMTRNLQFLWDNGVDMKLKPSAENLIKKDYKDILSLIWALMMKYIKFDEEDQGQLSAKDALLKWFQFHTQSYKNVEITNLTKSFHDGLGFCALLHKFRPELIPYDTLEAGKENSERNLKIAFDAAEKFFGLEQYLTPKDVLKLDEKGAMIYCSEYYYGINAQAKRDLAAKRITKLVEFTKENDQMKKTYVDVGTTLCTHLDSAEQLLADSGTVDNTLAGAEKRLADFNRYKADDKRAIIGKHLETEETFNTLALRLSNNNRPEFKPDAVLQPASLSKRIQDLQQKEKVEPALHAELHRQLQLVQLRKRHDTHAFKLTQWLDSKEKYLNTDVAVSTSGEARSQLKLFDSFVKECASMQNDSFKGLKDVGAKLTAEKYEHVADVQAKEGEIETLFAKLNELAAAKKPVLEDNLSRELYKEQINLGVKIHTEVFNIISKWNTQKSAYLTKKESIASVQEAKLALGVLDAYQRELADTKEGHIRRLTQQGQEIRDAKYETQYSQWVYPTPEKVQDLENKVDAFIADLATKAEAKQAVLDDDLAREQLKEKVINWVGNHQKMHEQLAAWVTDKLAYLAVKEDIQSSASAKYHIALLEAFEEEKSNLTAGRVATLKSLGESIRNEKYSTEHSSWTYEKPNDVTALESAIDKSWAELATASSQKKAILEDALAREEFAEHTRLLADTHEKSANQISAWGDAKLAELGTDPSINSISDAQYEISMLQSFDKELKTMTDSAVASLKTLGKDIVTRKYSTSLSTYSYENNDRITTAEATVDTLWSNLNQASATRKANLDAALKKEERKEELRLEFASLAGDFERFVNEKVLQIGNAVDQKSMFGSTLKELTDYESVLSAENSSIEQSISQKTAQYTAVQTEMTELGVTANPYTTTTVPSLEKMNASLTQALTARNELFQSEFAIAKENDALCKKFADAIVPLATSINEGLSTIVNTTEDEEAQLRTVIKYKESIDDDAAAIPQARTIEAQIKARDIKINTHTNVTTDDVQISLDQFKQALERKQPYLQSLIEYKQFRGISPEQYAEMETLFNEFDTDKTGTIDVRELRSCLYSLGEERLKSEVERYMKDYGTNGALKFESFRELMIKLLGDTGTPDSMTESFKLLSNGFDHITTEALAKVLKDAILQFITTTAPKLEDGVDFGAWIQEVFSR